MRWSETGRPAVIRLNYGIQRSENGGTAARAVCDAAAADGRVEAQGRRVAACRPAGRFRLTAKALQMPELMEASPLGRAARVVNMS